jgi:hypothetical protein
VQKRHQSSIACFEIFDARAPGDDAADPFGTDDGRQRRSVAIPTGDHQEIVLIDRRGFERDNDFICGGRSDQKTQSEPQPELGSIR